MITIQFITYLSLNPMSHDVKDFILWVCTNELLTYPFHPLRNMGFSSDLNFTNWAKLELAHLQTRILLQPYNIIPSLCVKKPFLLLHISPTFFDVGTL